MNPEDKLVVESKLHFLSCLELFKGLSDGEKALQEELYRQYTEMRGKEHRSED